MTISLQFASPSGRVGMVDLTFDQQDKPHVANWRYNDGAQAPPTAQHKKSKTCGGCGAPVPKVKWCGMRWDGEPWPKRWRIVAAWPTYVPAPGCGCITKLKAAKLALKQAYQLWKKA